MESTQTPSPVGSSPTPAKPSSVFFLRDERVLQVIFQIVFAIVLIAALYGLATSILSALASQNISPNLAFLRNRAGFDIGESPLWYSSNSTYWDAYTVGFINTLRVTVVGLVLSTVLGVFLGIFLLSANWLLRTISVVVVEFLRNTPLLVQLFIWYFVVMLSLPAFQQSIALPQEGYTTITFRFIGYVVLGYAMWRVLRDRATREVKLGILAAIVIVGELAARAGLLPATGLQFELQPWMYFNIRGFAFPEIETTGRFAEWAVFVVIGLAVAFIFWIYFGRLKEQTGKPYPRLLYAFLCVAILSIVGWVIVTSEPLPTTIPVVNAEGQTVMLPIAEAQEAGLIAPEDAPLYEIAPLLFHLPQKNNFRYTAGTPISPEFTALLLGLAIYTAAFIAEIVRAGILAVPRGQVEAARALGLSYSDVLRLVILPQALRVIIPPLGNQYLNLTKNSSLAIAIAFADLFQITTTIMNQSGQSVTGMTMVMVTYLILSLIIATVMNAANRRFQLVTR